MGCICGLTNMKLRQSFPVEFYVSDVGYLVFKGQNMNGYPDDIEAAIYMTPEQVQIFAACFSDLIHQQKSNWTGIENEL
jgi:hypothetical protein